MLRRNHCHQSSEKGFTIIELLVVMVLMAILLPILILFFGNTFNQYLKLQEDGSSFAQIETQAQRITKVLRGLTGIVSVGAEDITTYAYFYPNDTYASKVRYYKSVDGKSLLVDVTQMTANPPIGVPITSTLKTTTIITNFTNEPSINLFTYLDAGGNDLTLPITNLNSIKGIRVTLAAITETSTQTGKNTIVIQTSLRNRKSNL
jgi:prepilin-type N-terminal cleavage/methylation domain-containing protein